MLKIEKEHPHAELKRVERESKKWGEEKREALTVAGTRNKSHVVAGERPRPPQKDSLSESAGNPTHGRDWNQAAHIKMRLGPC